MIRQRLNSAEAHIRALEEKMSINNAIHIATVGEVESQFIMAKNESSDKDLLLLNLRSSLDLALKEGQVLKGQVGNITAQLNDLLFHQQLAAKNIVDASMLSKKKKWYCFFWPF